MPKLEKDGTNKEFFSELDIVLLTEMGFFGSLKTKNIKFNPKPREKHMQLQPKKTEPIIQQREEKIVDLHLEISKKIDELIAKNENKPHEPEFITTSEKTTLNTSKEVIEIRKPWMKNPDSPRFKTDFEQEVTFTQPPTSNELFEVQVPPTIQSELALELENAQNISFTKLPEQEHSKMHSFYMHKKHKDSEKVLTGLGRIKVRPKDERPNTKKEEPKQKNSRNNGVTQTKKELEVTMTELEKKKKEIEEMERLAKTKEEELKQKQEERKLRVKQKELELKKKSKLAKIKEREEQKLEKQKKLEQLKQEKQKKLEMKNAEREKQKKLMEQERLKKLEAKKLEKESMLKQIEAEKTKKEKQKEQEKLEKQKEIEAKRLEKQAMIKQLEAEKIKKQLEKKKQKLKQEKIKPIPEEKIVEKTEQGPPPIRPVTPKPEPIVKPELTLDEEVSQAITIIDNLLEKLPEEAIDEFVKSDDFAIYEKVVNKYKNKR